MSYISLLTGTRFDTALTIDDELKMVSGCFKPKDKSMHCEENGKQVKRYDAFIISLLSYVDWL